jgi:hypothetical protein
MAKTLDKTGRQEWIGAVKDLIALIEKWAGKKKWSTHRESVELGDTKLGAYQLPQLLIRAKNQRFYIAPSGFNSKTGEGRVDIECFPALARMLLIWNQGEWNLNTDAMIPWPETWSEAAFLKVIEALSRVR